MAPPTDAELLAYLDACAVLPGAPGSVAWQCLDGGRFASFTDGVAEFRVAVRAEHTNNSAHLFGGVAASLMDMVASLVLLVDGQGVAGATLAMAVQYVSPARVGDVLAVRAFADRRTRTTAFCRSEIRIVGVPGEKGLVATCSHTKSLGPAAFPRPPWAAKSDAPAKL
jgi:uncharacterized protein (TIGR00369 family)